MRRLKKGLLITFEGPEGSGKSTQVRLLCNYLRKKGVSVLQLREPGGTKIGEKIRTILLDPKNREMDAACEMFLYQAARAQLAHQKLIAALKRKQVVVLDRFLDATICYQGYGAGLSLNLIKQAGELASAGLIPDLTILLDINAQEGLRRAKGRDRMERKSLEFHRRVRRGYLKLAAQNPQRIKVVPMLGNVSDIQAQIRKVVEQRLGKSYGL